MSDAGSATKLRNAPAPEDDRKPDSPTDMSTRSWKYVLRKTIREFTSDQCTDLAASLTYYSVLSIFPALIAIVSLLGVVSGGRQAADTVIGILGNVAPGDAVKVLSGPIQQFADSPAAGFALISGIVLAIWSASGYVGAFTRAMNRIYEIDEGRTFLKLKPMQLLVTVIGIVLILLMAVIVIISGPVTDAIGNAIGVGDAVKLTWSIVKWPVLAAIVVLMVAILYYATPNAKQPKFRWMSTGALVAIVLLGLASVAFGFYVTTFGNYTKNYGSLAGVIVFLLWLWIANIALLFGAEFDAELERGRQLQAGIAAEEDIQLPPRGTKKSEKAQKTEKKDVAEGRRIREAKGGDEKDQDASDAPASDRPKNRRGLFRRKKKAAVTTE